MILKVKIKNFLSFYEETVFDMFPNPKREMFPNHVYSQMNVPLLKQAAIYGANGSGKSNFLEAIKLIRNIVVNKDFLKNFPIQMNKFRLISMQNEEPISFSIEFFVNNKYFIYQLEIQPDRISKEELYISGLGEKPNKQIFQRKDNHLVNKSTANNKNIIQATNQLLKNNPLSSILALNKDFPIFEDPKVKLAQKWFETKLQILSLRRINPELINLLSKKEEILKFTNEIFEKIGLGINKLRVEQLNLKDILGDENIQTKRFKEELIEKLAKGSVYQLHNDKLVYYYEEIDGEQIAKRLLFTHQGVEGFQNEMEIESQSDGTVRVLNLIPAFFDIKNLQCVYFIDEIENSIHPSLMVNLIKYLSTLDTKGQLIFTTHETELLNQQEIMRPDEVWFTEKINGSTKMYSLNEFKIHNTINIKNGYLEGRYGAIPFVGNLNE